MVLFCDIVGIDVLCFSEILFFVFFVSDLLFVEFMFVVFDVMVVMVDWIDILLLCIEVV